MRPYDVAIILSFYLEAVQNGNRGWISNTNSSDTNLISKLIEHGFTLGDPSPNDSIGYTVERMKQDGLVGVYYSKGRELK